MTYAIIESGSKQHWISEGDELLVEKLPQTEGTVDIKEVLLISDGQGKISLGKPHVSGASVSAKVVGLERGEKLISFKFKNKTGYHKTIGHRQWLTRLKIEKIQGA